MKHDSIYLICAIITGFLGWILHDIYSSENDNEIIQPGIQSQSIQASTPIRNRTDTLLNDDIELVLKEPYGQILIWRKFKLIKSFTDFLVKKIIAVNSPNN